MLATGGPDLSRPDVAAGVRRLPGVAQHPRPRPAPRAVIAPVLDAEGIEVAPTLRASIVRGWASAWSDGLPAGWTAWIREHDGALALTLGSASPAVVVHLERRAGKPPRLAADYSGVFFAVDDLPASPEAATRVLDRCLAWAWLTLTGTGRTSAAITATERPEAPA